jgi:hypothetical protein
VEVKRSLPLLCLITAALVGGAVCGNDAVRAASKPDAKVEFHTSDRCVACHNTLHTKSGEDISIGFEWSASIMANAGRDPYWQGSVRREAMDHPQASAAIQNECSACHMPMQHLMDRYAGKETDVFDRLPLSKDHGKFTASSDGVTCSVCHQIEKERLGTPESFNGNVVVAKVAEDQPRPEYGPFDIDAGHQRVMQSSTKGFLPQAAPQIRDAALCGSCHTLYTTALDVGGKQIHFPEQVPYQEWQHSDYANRQTCQECHMPVVNEAVAITTLYGQPRDGMHRHVFVGANFLMLHMLNEHRDELAVKARPADLEASANRTAEFLRTQAASVEIAQANAESGALAFEVTVVNRTGHKLPTAYPSRRAWLHVSVRDQHGTIVFESGHLNADGSIAGNDNDLDPLKFEPHYPIISRPDQVEIFEPILGDKQGQVTTGLLSAVDYLKDNRILPSGFDKATAEHDIRVVGDAASDAKFVGGSARTRYEVQTNGSAGPYHVEAELWYQPIGFRWAHNLEHYKADEPQRMVNYYERDARDSAVMLAHAEATW